jgi:xylulose-5-phosphate/fructose-6-phosphate phosphoketolase
LSGWLQGYLLTGRHGIFPYYEAFVHIVDGMMNQHAKFLKSALEVPWREPISSLNYLLTSEGCGKSITAIPIKGLASSITC